MTRILNWLGLMRVSEHEAQAWESKRVIGNLKQIIGIQTEEIADLRPDAERWRDRQRRERDRGQRRKGK